MSDHTLSYLRYQKGTGNYKLNQSYTIVSKITHFRGKGWANHGWYLKNKTTG